MELEHQPKVTHHNKNMMEDHRAFQLALELSMFTLHHASVKSPADEPSEFKAKAGSDLYMEPLENFAPKLNNMQDKHLNATCKRNVLINGLAQEDRIKKSQNMTECVPVPSSEHVAEIVGRQGCKIKALRAKTNTYIKTPVRGEEPVFVVTGRKEDVSKAKHEILSAADHFSLIRASRKPSILGTEKNNFANVSPNVPGQITIQVRVPYRVVGLVVGPKGATIKNIQQQTQTYIVTPSRDKEPVFEITGILENVNTARRYIEAHIAQRTGNTNLQQPGDCNTMAASPNLDCSKNCVDETRTHVLPDLSELNSKGSILSPISGISCKFSNVRSELINIWGSLTEFECDEGIDESSCIWSPLQTYNSSAVESVSSSSDMATASPTDSILNRRSSRSRSNFCSCDGNEMIDKGIVCGHH